MDYLVKQKAGEDKKHRLRGPFKPSEVRAMARSGELLPGNAVADLKPRPTEGDGAGGAAIPKPHALGETILDAVPAPWVAELRNNGDITLSERELSALPASWTAVERIKGLRGLLKSCPTLPDHALLDNDDFPVSRGRSRGAATFLALFFGFLGFHDFYLGQKCLGAIKLCLCSFMFIYIPSTDRLAVIIVACLAQLAALFQIWELYGMTKNAFDEKYNFDEGGDSIVTTANGLADIVKHEWHVERDRRAFERMLSEERKKRKK